MCLSYPRDRGWRRRACMLVLMLGMLPWIAGAQDFRGAVGGRVTDESGGVLPGVTVTVTNTSTNVNQTAVTNDAGTYSLVYLTPGTYTVVAELQGFKKVNREVEVRLGDRLEIDFKMSVGGIEEVVNVGAETPLLETRTGSAGQVIGEKQIALMPLSDGNPFVLARLAPGVAYHGDLKFSRPFDNGGTSDFTADGGPGRNEFTLDGSPNMANGRRVAFVPPANAVQEFKVETATFDAQQGHTAGATVNVTLKSGTNRIKGDAYYHYRDEVLSGNDFFLERAGRPKDDTSYKRYGFSAGGPAVLGKLYDGRDKTFFFTAFEWLYDTFPEPGQFTVPTAAQRNGDFSALLSQGIVIYDPLTAVRRADGRVERQPFPGNIIPSGRISPIAREYLKYYPLPNQAGTATGVNNYITANSRGDDFYSMNYRVDHVLTDKQRFFVRYSRNNRVENRGSWTGEINGVRPTGNFLFRINDAVNVDHVWNMSSSSLLNVRASWSRFQEPSIRQHQGIFDPTSLLFPPAATQYFGSNLYFPRFEFDDGSFSDLGDTFSGGTNARIFSFQPTWTMVRGDHSFRSGADIRAYREDGFPSVHSAGRYDFVRNSTSLLTRQLDNSPAAAIGQDLAAMLLGMPSGGTIDRSADRFNQVIYGGVFVQDDWKVSNKLTLNLGLRWEYEGAPTERDNRNVRGWDPNAELRITSAAQAAYAANPIPEIPPSQFRVRGGLTFASEDNRGFYNPDKNNFQPRVGFAYQANDKTVVRGGWAIYTVPALFDAGINQSGFSQGTSIVPTPDNGVTIRATLANPWPDGVAAPPGNSNGPNTFLGRTIGRFTDNLDYRNGQSMRWSLSMQRELPGQFVVEGAYVASRSYDLTTDFNLNPVPRQYLSTSSVRDNNTINFLTANVPNPFAGLLPGEGLNGSAQRQQLLRPYPQFTGIDVRLYDGSSQFDSAQFRLSKRFRSGYMFDLAYTWSDFKEKVSRLNETDPDYEERFQETHLPHRLVVNGIWELPFGRGRKYGSGANPVVNGIIGNWSVSAIWNWQSGRPNLSMGNVYYDGDITQLNTKYSSDPTVPVFDTRGFYFHDAAVQTNGVDDPAKQRADTRIRLANNVRTTPSRWNGLRGPRYTNWDMSFVKAFDMGRVRAQFHIELYNAFNDVFYNNPNLDPTNANFGLVSSQNNLPRNIQIGSKIVF